MLDDLRQALTSRDANRFRRAAHSLKSNANTFGALALGAMARTLEIDGAAMADDQKAQAVVALDEEYARVAMALSGMRDE